MTSRQFRRRGLKPMAASRRLRAEHERVQRAWRGAFFALLTTTICAYGVSLSLVR